LWIVVSVVLVVVRLLSGFSRAKKDKTRVHRAVALGILLDRV
jgi:hypothetical protein